MSEKWAPLSASLYHYLLEISLQESPSARQLRQLSLEHEFSQMLTPPEQSQFLAFLIKLLQAKRVIEVGAFTGYSTLVMASALPEEGMLIACDVNESWVNVGKPFWRDAEVDHKILVRINPAVQTLQQLLDEGQREMFDLIYVDADKLNYRTYLALGLELIHPRGLIVFDNVLRLGRRDGDVPARMLPATRALDDFNRWIQQDTTLEISMLPLGCGVSLVRRKLL